jgi:hypothetical protein
MPMKTYWGNDLKMPLIWKKEFKNISIFIKKII